MFHWSYLWESVARYHRLPCHSDSDSGVGSQILVPKFMAFVHQPMLSSNLRRAKSGTSGV